MCNLFARMEAGKPLARPWPQILQLYPRCAVGTRLQAGNGFRRAPRSLETTRPTHKETLKKPNNLLSIAMDIDRWEGAWIYSRHSKNEKKKRRKGWSKSFRLIYDSVGRFVKFVECVRDQRSGRWVTEYFPRILCRPQIFTLSINRIGNKFAGTEKRHVR